MVYMPESVDNQHTKGSL